MKKHTKRLLSLIMALLIIGTCAVTAYAADETKADDTAQTEEAGTLSSTDTVEETAEKPLILDARTKSKGQIYGTVPLSAAIEDEPVEKGSTPAKVTGFTADASTKGTIKLSWMKAANASGYNIYYKNLSDSSDLVLMTSIKATQFNVRNLPSGTKYEFIICGYSIQNGTVREGADTSVTTSTQLDDIPYLLLTASSVHIGIRWPGVSGAEGYIVYREDATSGGKYIRQKALSAATREYYDTSSTEGKPYNYRVSPYIKVGGQIIESTSPSLETYCGLSAVSDRGSYGILSKAYLKWNTNKYASGYEIFYSTDGTNYSVMTATTGDVYNSYRLGTRRYYFRIRPYKIFYDRKIVGTFDTIAIDISPTAYGYNPGGTYVAICIETQHMWFYKDNNLVVDTPVVTGNYNSMDTPKGYHSVQNKASPCSLVGPGYVSVVQYWIAFIGSGYGIHDASWRSDSEFGGETYKGNGSHGCVNTPYNAVRTIYNNISVGTPVVVY